MTTRPHTHEPPRGVLLKHATDAAVICRRHGDEDRASEWDTLAAELTEGRCTGHSWTGVPTPEAVSKRMRFCTRCNRSQLVDEEPQGPPEPRWSDLFGIDPTFTTQTGGGTDDASPPSDSVPPPPHATKES